MTAPPYERYRRRRRPGVPGCQSVQRDVQEVLAELKDEELLYGITTREGGALVHRVAKLRGEPPTDRALHEQVLVSELLPGGDVRFTPQRGAGRVGRPLRRGGGGHFLPPTSVDRIRAVTQDGERLPQKPTFLWPKP